ncbi:midcut-by-XrtH protein [Comamonas odontotermitis]|uniref:midcut-by-XrtH protein n=1 Tax=Comamonas odontotermitis TaxID=379895 RepID=UPI00366B490D
MLRIISSVLGKNVKITNRLMFNFEMFFSVPQAPKRSAALTLSLAGTLVSPISAFAQATNGYCQISLGYSGVVAVAPPSAVPGLTLFSVGILAAALGVLAWHYRHSTGKILALGLWASASLLTAQGGEGMVQAARAAAPYEFSNPSGGMVTDSAIAYTNPAPLITVTNTSGARIKVTSNANAGETGSCSVGTEVAPNGSCTTVSQCTAPSAQLLTVSADPTVACDFDPAHLLYTVQSHDDPQNPSYYIDYSIYSPMLTSVPVLTPSNPSVITTFTYTPGPKPTVDPITGSVTNLLEIGSGTAMVTMQAPIGYTFDSNDPLANTKTWNIPYQGCLTRPTPV